MKIIHRSIFLVFSLTVLYGQDVIPPVGEVTTQITSPAKDNTSSISVRASDAVSSGANQITVTATATISGNPGTTVYLSEDNGNTFATSVAITGANTPEALVIAKLSDGTGLPDGTYTDLKFVFTDQASNSSGPVTADSFIIDNTQPSGNEVTAVPTPRNDQTPAVDIRGNDNISIGTDKLKVSAASVAHGGTLYLQKSGSGDFLASQNMNGGNTNTTFVLASTIGGSDLDEGTYSDVIITIEDEAGNQTAFTLTTFIIDVTDPSGSQVEAVLPTPGSDSTPDLKIKASDDISDGTNEITVTATVTGVTPVYLDKDGNPPFTTSILINGDDLGVTIYLASDGSGSGLSNGTYNDLVVTFTD